MARANAPFVSLNGGEIGREVQARVNLEGYGATASILENILPEAAGPMRFRPGLKFCVEAPEVTEEEVLVEVFPSVEATSDGLSSVGTSHTITLPSGIQAGNLLLLIVGLTTSASLNVPSGWTQLDTGTNALIRMTVLYRVADGTEGTTLAATTTGSAALSFQCYRIAQFDGVPEISTPFTTGVVGAGTVTADPPTVAPSWGSGHSLWIAAAAVVSNDYTDFAVPSGYSSLIFTNASPALASVRRELLAAFQDPSAFTWTTIGGGNSFVTATIAIKPGVVPTPPPDDLTVIEEFVYKAEDQKYLLLLTHQELRIVEDGGIVVRDDVGVSIVNPAFAPGLAGWTNFSTGDSTAEGDNEQGLILLCDGPDPCGVRQNLAVTAAGEPHGLDIEVTHGPALLRIGAAVDAEDVLAEILLRTGTHRLSFTPETSVWIQISSNVRREVIVGRISIAAAGDLVLATPWDGVDLRSLRLEQSLNVMYVTDGVHAKRRIERHGAASWSLTLSDEQDGPFAAPNTDETILVTPSTRAGNGTLAASKTLFREEDVGSLFRITQNGQYQARAITGADQFTSPAIRVTGVGTARDITWTVEGTFAGTVRLQRSVGNDSTWEDVSGGTGTSSTAVAGTFAFRDGEDNSVIYYRVGIKAGQYTSGSADVTIFFPGGATDGIARITGFNSDLSVDMEALTSFAALTASSEWTRGAWSDFFGHPKGVAVWDGRLWNGREAEFWGSVSEVYESHAAGDDPADAIARTVSVGAQAPSIQWMLGLNRLVIGTAASAADVQPVVVQTGLVSVQASQLDEVVTPSSLTVRGLDAVGVYVDESGSRPMEIVWDAQSGTYRPRSLVRLHRDIGRGGIRQVAFARRPDLRLFMIRADGQCLVKLFDRDENALGWCRLITDGTFESVAVLPEEDEDEVYFIVRRTLGATEVRYMEKLDPLYLESAAAANFLDCYVRYTGAAATNVPAGTASHLVGETVKVWADGAYMGTNTIDANGQLATALGSARTPITIGLSYTGRYRSSKLAFSAQAGTALGQKGRPSHIGLLLLGSTRQIEYGADFDTMERLPDLSGDDVTHDAGPGLIDDTTDFFSIPAGHSRDPRLCLRFEAPHPVTVQGYVLAFHLAETVQA